MDEFTPEEWRPIPDWEGWYEVSDYGRVRSVDRTVPTSRGQRRYLPVMLRQTPDKRGYLRVKLRRPGVQRLLSVHQAVLRAFVGPPPSDKHEGLHGDGSPRNNTLFNLRWGTRPENMRDMVQHKRGWASKTHCPREHEYTLENTLWSSRGDGRRFRLCRQCQADRRSSAMATS